MGSNVADLGIGVEPLGVPNPLVGSRVTA